MRLLDSVLMTMGLSQPLRRFLGELLMLRVIIPGRATFLNLSRYRGYAEKTFRRWFRRKVDWAQFNVTAIRAVVPGDHESVLAFDPSFVAKSGKRTAGLGRFWNGCASRAEPGRPEPGPSTGRIGGGVGQVGGVNQFPPRRDYGQIGGQGLT